MRNRKSLRLPYHDYSWPGEYFITIVTKDREGYFGLPHECSSRELVLRNIDEEVWRALFDETCHPVHYVLMPNHFHGIIRLLEGRP